MVFSFVGVRVGLEVLRTPLAVPEILITRFRSQNFDRCALPFSLFRPQDALAGDARAGYPTYALSRGASSPT